MSYNINSNNLELLLNEIEILVKNKAASETIEKKLVKYSDNIPEDIVIEFTNLTKKIVEPKDSQKKGKFIVITGTDKTGKETHTFNPKKIQSITSVYQYLNKIGYKVMKIFLPSYNTIAGSFISSHIGRNDTNILINGKVSAYYAWMFWALDRAQYNEKINSWLKKSNKHIVLSKRWCETNVAYQLPLNIKLERLLDFEKHIIKQDYTYVIDVDLDEIMNRIFNSDEQADEYENKDFLNKVNYVYLNLEKYYKYGKIIHINGNQSIVDTNKEIISKINEMF